MSEELLRIWKKIKDNPKSKVFHIPVSLDEVTDYAEKIKQPMDLSTIRQRMNAGAVTTPQQLHALLSLTFRNALTYNGKRTAIYQAAAQLDAIQVQEFRTSFPQFANEFNTTKAVASSSPPPEPAVTTSTKTTKKSTAAGSSSEEESDGEGGDHTQSEGEDNDDASVADGADGEDSDGSSKSKRKSSRRAGARKSSKGSKGTRTRVRSGGSKARRPN